LRRKIEFLLLNKNLLMAYDLLLCVLVYVVSIMNYYYFSNQFIQGLSGAVLCCFIPGYFLLCFIYPSAKNMSFSFRALLSFPLSVATVGIFGFASGASLFNWNMSSVSFYIFFGIFIFIFFICISFVRIRTKSKVLNYQHILFQIRAIRKSQRVTIGITFFIVIATAMVILNPSSDSMPSQIYVVGLDGKVDSLPSKFTDNKPIEFLLGVKNHTGNDQAFLVEVSVNNTIIHSIVSPTLKDGDEWNSKVWLDKPIKNRSGASSWQKIDLHLRDSSQKKALGAVYFWVLF
jgi:uncharacterized membrane protein